MPLDRQARNNNFLDRLDEVAEKVQELETVLSNRVFRVIPGDEGDLGGRAYTDAWLSLGWEPANVEKLHVYDGAIKSEGVDNILGGQLVLQNKPSTPADLDVAGNIRAFALNDANEPIVVGEIYFQIADVTDGSEDGNMIFVTQKDGNDAFILQLVGDQVGIDEQAPSAKLHVKGDLFVDATNAVATFGDGSSPTSISVDGAAGQTRDVRFQSNGSLRWLLRTNGETESGSDTGSNFTLVARDDSGGFLAYGFRCQRSDGAMQLGSPTGGYKGTGTLNAEAVYDDNTLLTPYVLEAARTGAVDLDALDDKVPDRVRGAVDDRPERTEVRTHGPARRFAANMEQELDPSQYAAAWKQTGHLPNFPTEQEWEEEGNFSTGDLIQRLMEAVEVQAVHIDNLNQRLAALEAAA